MQKYGDNNFRSVPYTITPVFGSVGYSLYICTMEQNNFSKYLPKLTFLICFLAIILSSLRIFYHLFNHTPGFLTVPQDDFYYYLVTAKNIIYHGKSSFDGITLTNG